MPPIQGFELTTEDDVFDLPDPPDEYDDRSDVSDYVTRDTLTKYRERV